MGQQQATLKQYNEQLGSELLDQLQSLDHKISSNANLSANPNATKEDVKVDVNIDINNPPLSHNDVKTNVDLNNVVWGPAPSLFNYVDTKAAIAGHFYEGQSKHKRLFYDFASMRFDPFLKNGIKLDGKWLTIPKPNKLNGICGWSKLDEYSVLVNGYASKGLLLKTYELVFEKFDLLKQKWTLIHKFGLGPELDAKLNYSFAGREPNWHPQNLVKAWIVDNILHYHYYDDDQLIFKVPLLA